MEEIETLSGAQFDLESKIYDLESELEELKAKQEPIAKEDNNEDSSSQ